MQQLFFHAAVTEEMIAEWSTPVPDWESAIEARFIGVDIGLTRVVPPE